MNKQRFRELVKRLHPDTSGDGRTVAAYRLVVSVWHNRKSRFHKCFCGRTILKINKHCLMHRHVKISGAITALLLCLSLSIGGEFKMPPMPPVKKKVKALHSPKGVELYSAVPMAIAIPPRQLYLWWNHPMTMPNQRLEFDIEHRESFSAPWVRIGRTNQPPFPISATGAAGMWRVGAHWRQ